MKNAAHNFKKFLTSTILIGLCNANFAAADEMVLNTPYEANEHVAYSYADCTKSSSMDNGGRPTTVRSRIRPLRIETGFLGGRFGMELVLGQINNIEEIWDYSLVDWGNPDSYSYSGNENKKTFISSRKILDRTIDGLAIVTTQSSLTRFGLYASNKKWSFKNKQGTQVSSVDVNCKFNQPINQILWDKMFRVRGL